MSELISNHLDDPITLFAQWFEAACADDTIKEPTAMCLATAAQEYPSARMVLLKAYDAQGFVFYTNLDSRKSKEIKARDKAALCFYWPAHDRQIRIVGDVEAVENSQADAYFASRVRGKQLGAWASKQSQPLENRVALTQRVAEMEERFAQQPVPRPPFWSGWRVVPHEIEFWEQKQYRLHERVQFLLKDGKWHGQSLYP